MVLNGQKAPSIMNRSDVRVSTYRCDCMFIIFHFGKDFRKLKR